MTTKHTIISVPTKFLKIELFKQMILNKLRLSSDDYSIEINQGNSGFYDLVELDSLFQQQFYPRIKIISRKGDIPKYTKTQPLILPAFSISSNIDIHESISIAMGQLWNNNIKQSFKNLIENHLSNISDVVNFYGLDKNESLCIIYYTVDAQHIKINETREKSVYKELNSALSGRDTPRLEKWKPYLYYLMRGLKKLPSETGTVYRGWDLQLTHKTERYHVGNSVIWPAFTSTSTSVSLLSSFANIRGTWASMDIVEGKDISKLSIYPQESELLLLPNSEFRVEEILGPSTKRLVIEFSKLPPNSFADLDMIHLKQITPTTSVFQSI